MSRHTGLDGKPVDSEIRGLEREREQRHCVVCRVRFISGQESRIGGDTHQHPDIGSDINQSPDGGGLRAAAVEAETEGVGSLYSLYFGDRIGSCSAGAMWPQLAETL